MLAKLRESKIVINIRGRYGFRHLIFLSLLTLASLWPLAHFGRPGYIIDSSVYYRNGETAVSFALQRVLPAQQTKPPAPIQGDDGVRAARSIVYGAFVYVLGWPHARLVLLVLAQALLTAVMVLLFMKASGSANRLAPLIGLAALLAGGTAIGPFVTLATPDIFAGLTILGLATLTLYHVALTTFEKIALLAITSFAIASHTSHLLLALAFAGLVAVLAAWGGMRRGWHALGGTVWTMATVGSGLLLVVATAVIGFGEVSVAPKRYPFVLARSIEDGPARWYLDAHCRTERYTVCELFPLGFPTTAGSFLWGPSGIAHRATAEQMDRIRDEEATIVRRAVEAYPSVQLTSSLGNVGEQLLYVGIDPAIFRNKRMAPDGSLVGADEKVPLRWHVRLQQIVTIVSLLVILAGVWKADRRLHIAAVLIGLSIIGNSVICAVVSAPDIRYENRVLWLLPLLAFAAIIQRLRSSRAGTPAEELG